MAFGIIGAGGCGWSGEAHRDGLVALATLLTYDTLCIECSQYSDCALLMSGWHHCNYSRSPPRSLSSAPTALAKLSTRVRA